MNVLNFSFEFVLLNNKETLKPTFMLITLDSYLIFNGKTPLLSKENNPLLVLCYFNDEL